jgi:predicted NBD/HSP70 family sugar kinase
MTTAYIGVDLHRTVIQICVLDARGERVAEERVRYQSLEEAIAVRGGSPKRET